MLFLLYFFNNSDDMCCICPIRHITGLHHSCVAIQGCIYIHHFTLQSVMYHTFCFYNAILLLIISAFFTNEIFQNLSFI